MNFYTLCEKRNVEKTKVVRVKKKIYVNILKKINLKKNDCFALFCLII